LTTTDKDEGVAPVEGAPVEGAHMISVHRLNSPDKGR